MAATPSPFKGKTAVERPFIELEALDEDNQLKKFRQRAKQGWELVVAFEDHILIGRTHDAKEQAALNREAKKAERQAKKGKGKKKTTAKKRNK